jgi:hypothetical protein
MSTISLSIKYRPVRIGFLIPEGSIDNLVKAAELNCLLWGGIYNPIIPVSSKTEEFANKLINLFSVDVLYPITHTYEIDKVLESNKYLKAPTYYSQEIFYEDSDTKKNVPGYLDAGNIFNFYWQNEFKNKSKEYRSNFLLIEWDDDDTCSNLFSVLFGKYPTLYNLKEDYKETFLKALCAKELKISRSDPLISNLNNLITPIEVTNSKLRGYGGGWKEDGLYIGYENKFIDLLNFWNLRASGIKLNFLSVNHFERFEKFTQEYIKILDTIPKRNPNVEEWITIHALDNDEALVRISKKLHATKRFAYSHWDLNVKPSSFYFRRQQVLGSVEKSFNKYSISILLPEKKFFSGDIDNRNVSLQHLIASVEPLVEYGYPNHTLSLPFIRELNEFYSREVYYDPFHTRVEKMGLAIIIKTYDNSLYLNPIPHQKIIEKIFELASFKTKESQPGLIAKQIIHNMHSYDPIEDCRVFKITGVRELIASHKTKKGRVIKWSEATKIIWDNNLSKFENLYIEPRNSKKLNANDVFNYLIKKRIFSPKLKPLFRLLRVKKTVKCRRCGLKEKILLSYYEKNWECPFCHFMHFMPKYIKEDFRSNIDRYWGFIRSGLFAKDNNQEGAIPVIVGLLTFKRVLNSSNVIYSTSLNLKNSLKCEIDFSIVHNYYGELTFGIAECKSAGQKITPKEINNLKEVQDRIKNLGINCYIIFCKMNDQYELDEIDLFKTLKKEYRKFIILSNKEMEPYHPYWEIPEKENLPEKYALEMEGMHQNSMFLYIN